MGAVIAREQAASALNARVRRSPADAAADPAAAGRAAGGGGVAAWAAPVVSWGCRCAGGGSAVMILTGGVDFADGEERVFGTLAAALGAGGGGGLAPSPLPTAGPVAARSFCRASNGRSPRMTVVWARSRRPA